MNKKIIKKKDFITTKWYGGETTQFIIYPENARLEKRDFLFRISSATFTTTESKFSDFTGFQRYIFPLQGEIILYHEGLYDRALKEYEVEYFDGSWNTFSENSPDCRDYNFIIKSGSLAKMQILAEGDKYKLKKSQIVTIFSADDFSIKINDTMMDMEGFTLLVLEMDTNKELNILKTIKPIIITEFLI